jgi:hypothetical protein
MNLRKSIIAACLVLSPAAASAQVYLPQGVGLPAQSVIANTLPTPGDAVAVPFAQLKSSLNVPQAQNCATSTWVNSISTLGIFGCVQPGINDISGLSTALGGLLPLTGGTMSGNVTMGGNNISGIGTITATTYSGLPTGSSSTVGVVKVDGATITASGGTISAVGLSTAPVTAALTADVPMNAANTFFAGPTVAQGSTGTWFVCGTLELTDTAAAANITLKLWDGTNLIKSSQASVWAANGFTSVTLCGTRASPAGNLRIDAESGNTTSKILFNRSGLALDSSITAWRIQ